MAFFYEADPPLWKYTKGYKGNKAQFPNITAKKIERLFQKVEGGDHSEKELTWENKAEGKKYKINVESLTMESVEGGGYRYNYRNAIEVSREGYPYPQMGRTDSLKKVFAKYPERDEDGTILDASKVDPQAQQSGNNLWQVLKMDPNGIDVLLFHAVGQADNFFEFSLIDLSERFARIGCQNAKDIAPAINDMKTKLFADYSSMDKALKNTRKKQMKKLAQYVFHMCAGGNKKMRELPYIPPVEEEEEVAAADDDSEEEPEQLRLPVMYQILYIGVTEADQRLHARRFPLARDLDEFIRKFLPVNDRIGITKDEWTNIAEFLYTTANKEDADPDAWPTLLENFISGNVVKVD